MACAVQAQENMLCPLILPISALSALIAMQVYIKILGFGSL